MSRRSSEQGPDSPGIYDGLLFAALFALIMGIAMMCFELNLYGWKVG